MKIEARGIENGTKESEEIFGYVPSGQKNGESKSLKEMGYWGYTSGMVEARRAVKYGYFETRVKPLKDKIVSGFWMSADIEGGDWTELDLMESSFIEAGVQKFGTDMRKRIISNAHVFRNVSAGIGRDNMYTVRPNVYEDKGVLADQYKVYAMDWNPKRITWLVDGYPYVSIENKYWHSPLYLKFDVETNMDWHGVIPDIKTMGRKTYNVDYIRVYSYKRRNNSGPEIDIQDSHLNLTAYGDLLAGLDGSETPEATSTDEGDVEGTITPTEPAMPDAGGHDSSAAGPASPMPSPVPSREPSAVPAPSNKPLAPSSNPAVSSPSSPEVSPQSGSAGSPPSSGNAPLSPPPISYVTTTPSKSAYGAGTSAKTDGTSDSPPGTLDTDFGVEKKPTWFGPRYYRRLARMWYCRRNRCVKIIPRPWTSKLESSDRPEDVQADVRPPLGVKVVNHPPDVLIRAPYGNERILERVVPSW